MSGVLSAVRARLLAEGSVRGRRIGIVATADHAVDALAAALAGAGADVVLADDARVAGQRHDALLDAGAALVRLGRDGPVPCIATAGERVAALRLARRDAAGQAIVMALLDRTNLLAAGRRLVVLGYGTVGQGIARSARGVAARVVVCETDPLAALAAHHDGFAVVPVAQACRAAELLVAGTGAGPPLPGDAIDLLPDGALIASAGSGARADGRELAALRAHATTVASVRDGVEELRLADGRALFLVGDDRGVAHPAGDAARELADLAAALQALCVAHLLTHADRLAPGVHAIPPAVDAQLAHARLAALGLAIDG